MISRLKMTNDFLLVGNGEDIWVICGCVVYNLKKPFIKELSMARSRDILDVEAINGERVSMPGISSYETTINLMSCEISVEEKKRPILIPELLFKKCSIQELFKIINKKIKTRDNQ